MNAAAATATEAPGPGGMRVALGPEEREAAEGYRRFVQAEIAPHADRWDRREALPRGLVRRLAEGGCLGAEVAPEHGGGGLAPLRLGLLHEEVGRACSSVRSLLTVHGMVARALARWGDAALREAWLPRMARGERLAAFALTETEAGSDAGGLAARVRREGDELVLEGTKRWVTAGRVADVVLVLARLEGAPAALLVETTRPGVERRPVRGLLGCRASMVADLAFRECRVPAANLLSSRSGFGVSHVAESALDAGRYTVAWGCVGIAQACVDASLDYASRRSQFGRPLREHQLVARMLSDMIVGLKAARLLCCRAAHLRATRSPRAPSETTAAKYLASREAVRAASDAVQIHGANGCGPAYPVQRYLRDAKIMEIIEGSNEMQQILIARSTPDGEAVRL